MTFLVALALTWLHGGELLKYAAYSEAIGLLSWISIETGRKALNREGEDWPEGWRGLALVVGGCAFGFTAGMTIGDAAFGHSTWTRLFHQPRDFISALTLSGLLGAVISMYYYVQGRTAAQAARVAAAERDATLARLSMLQSQLEPHMLFNTLANLRVLIDVDPARAQAMLDRLIAFLRATLSASRTAEHSLAAEFDRLDDYLALMSVRMGPRLRVQLDLPAELRAQAVPPLLLQPLVENAIKHGLEPKVEGGRLVVSARSDGRELALAVRDTGVGLDSAASSMQAGTKFGLHQVKERLRALHGDRASLHLAAADGAEGGTLARITLPLPNPTGP